MESDKNQWSLSRKQKTGGAAFKTSVSEEQDMASSTGKSLQLQRPASPAESFLSMKSDRSKEDPLNFSSQVLSSLALQRLASPAESFLSMKSDRSDEEPLNLSDEVLRSLQLQRPASPAESFLSMKSDRSKEDPLNFSDQVLRSLQLQRPASPAESFLSMKSDRSKEDPLNFSSQVLRSLQLQRPASPAESFLSMKRDRPKGDPLNFSNQVLSTREHQGADSSATSHDFMESNRSSDQPSGFSNEGQSSRKPTPVSTHNSKLTKKEKDAIKKMKHKLKSTICTKYEQQSKQETDTELCVQAEDKEELVQTNYDDMFKVRTVLTTGVAGVGKTFQTSMFMLNWAKEKTCKEIDLVVSLHFSELNKGDVQSLEDLLNDHFGDVKQQLVPSYDEFKVLFILDGLEQCKFELDFKNNKDLSDIKIKASMDELLTNLIKGTLLPSAHLWIISQPSGIDKIPPKYIQKVTKCQETSNRRKKLVTHLRQRILRGNSQHEATKHPNQKDTEHIMREDSTAEVTDEQKKKQTVVKVKATSDIFKDGNGEKIRTVLTVGEAGIGKSFHVQKFIKEWAENKKRSLLSKLGFGKASNNELIIFPLDVCELNKIKDQEFSLVGLLKHFFKETKEFVITDFSQFRVLFVLDGVEKFESQLDFDIKNPVTDVSESASVDVLLTNLIKGNLLPLAQVWITSRPSAVNWLNADKLVYRRTEIREKDINKKMKDNLKTRISKKYGKQSEQETDTELCIQAKGKEELMKTNYDDMFKVRTVLTTGVAGVGKTFQTRMFMLNWAKEKTCKEIDLVVSLHFSELNKYKGNVQSLEDLLNDHFRAVKKHGVLSYDEFKVLFILDGLEQCKFELDFTNSKDLSNMKKPADLSDETNSPILNHTNDMNNSPDLRFTGDVNQSQDSGDMHNSPDLSVTNKSADLSDMKKKASMDELLTNLIKGTLLPSAHLWIISQPSGVDKIPADYIQKVTKCQETSKRWKKLVTHLRERLLSENSQPEDINHPNQKNTEHIMREDSTAEDTDEQKKKQTVVKVKATSDIFKDGNGEKIRTVLTVGEAGIGKSFHVQKFMKAWAENTNPSLLTWVTEKAKHLFGQVSDNELIIFPLSVCELNKIKHKEFSLVGLLNHFFKETKEFVITDFSQFTVLFVLDGVGKFESQLDFDIKNPVTDVRKSASVDVLLTNLIKGNLLPSARVWITSRPSAVNWLNVDKLVYRRTEIREKSDKEKLKTYLKTRICTKYGKQSKQETDTELCVQAEDKEELVQTNYDDMFKVRTVLTTGVAGVGKTFQTSMFMLNWAKEKTCKEIDLVVSLHFSELNKGDVQSLEDLLNDHFSDVKQQLVPSFDEFILLFILDGLEQCKFELDFKNNKDLSDIKEKASMDELLTNLIKGTLLPSAHLWIISQPSGIDKIPPDYIQKVTKCQETSERRKKLVTHLRERLLRENSQPEDINHPNHKNIEYIMREDSTAEVTDEQKKKQTVVKVKATSDIFKDGNGEKIRTVLTVGEAGIGKSFHVQKFMKEWAENTNPARFTWVTEKAKGPFGKASDNELVIFPLDVCELNKIKDQEFSLVGLLNHFFKETKEFVITDFSQFRVLFVLDGIEKFESQLDFDIKNPVTDVRKSASVDVLLRNLIKGNLLPSAQVWITSRPSAVNWLNFDKLVYRRTEIREEDADKKMKRNLKMIICTKYEEQSKQETDTELCVQGEDKEELVQTNYDDMFKVRTVLTTGVAGVGKTFQSSMFMYNWAKEKTCKEIDLVVSLHFSELNKGDIQSLEDLLNDHFRAVKKHGVLSYDEFKVLFVLDGLEQCKFELDFTNSKDLGDMKKPADLSDETNSLILNHTNDMNNSSDLSDAGDMDQLQDSDDVNNSPDLSDAGDMDQLQDSGDMHNSPDLSDAGDMDRLQDSGDMHNSPDLSDAGDMDQLQDSDDVNNSPDLSVTNESADLTDINKKASMDELLTNLIKGTLLPSAHLWIISQPSGIDKIPTDYIQKVTKCQETSERWKKLVTHLHERLLRENSQPEDINHPNQKNTEHIIREGSTAEDTDEQKKKQTVVKVKATSDIFKDGNGEKIRTVLTVGEADIGKSFHVQKFMKEWAENTNPSLLTWVTEKAKGSFGQVNDNELIIFPFSIFKLNLIKDQEFTLVGLLNHLFKENKEFVITRFSQFTVLFVLDGIEKFESPLDFDIKNPVTDVSESASVDVLLRNLIKGNLLPSAQVWITSRPSAVNWLNADKLVYRRTEIREKPDITSHRNLKSHLKDQFTCVSEGIDRQKASAVLNEIYTELYIIEGQSEEVNDQQETRQIQNAKFKPVREETAIKYNKIFTSVENKPIKTVMTLGVAGIGKTITSMKYMLDWADGKDIQNIYYMFPLPFRELNLRREEQQSFEELLHQFFPAMRTSEISDYNKYQILIVLDGFDECRLDLDFGESNKCIDVKESTSVNVLLTNLIQGNLLPKAQIWITSRPAASNRIPADKVDRVTEVRGFNDEQKEEYFRKRLNDKNLAENILSHVKKSRSLYIMCHIPVFCWITSKVLEDYVTTNQEDEMPKTLTDMYTYFLLLECRQANRKYSEDETREHCETDECWNERNKETVISLGKLAFEELVKGNFLFTEENLTQCGTNETNAAVFSGIFTQIKRESTSLYQQKLFCFVHLSIQEFLAAFYVFNIFNNKGENLLTTPPSVVSDLPASDFYKKAVDKALDSKHGDWDLFLRFLLGLSLETNQEHLKELLKDNRKINKETNKETAEYIKKKINEDISDADKNLNLLYCLNELNDHSLVKDIKKQLRSGKQNFEDYSAGQWSALTFVLLTSDENLDVFDLKKYRKSEKVLLGMLPVVKVSKCALLSWCELSEQSCSGLTSSVLSSAFSNLSELDFSHNDLLDSGVQHLAEGLKSPHCKLEILKLSGCQVTEKGCSSLALSLESNTASLLKHLDLSYNHPGDSGTRRLTDIVESPNMKLKKLLLDHAGEHRLKPGIKKYGVELKLDETTAGKRLLLLEGNRKARTAKKVEEKPARPECEDRFKRSQVFCDEGLKGVCYWEVDWRGTVSIAAAYKRVGRKWDSSGGLGCNEISWGLYCSGTKCTAMHGKTSKPLEIPTSPKIAVLLDWEGGTLSYYSVSSEKLSLIHTFHAKFREPLFPAFWFKTGSVTLCDLD